MSTTKRKDIRTFIRPWKRSFQRGLALFVAVVTVGTLHPTQAAPGDIFSTPAPAIGDAAPTASPIADGDAGVSTSTGAFTYSYPIAVPPGRSGMQPGLSLSYSSQAPIYGTLAAGWTITGLHLITRDTSEGRLQTNADGPKYQSSLSGGRPLVVVNETAPAGVTTYRAQNDSSWIRYQRYTSGSFRWRALSPDGTVYYFGDQSQTSTCTIVNDGYAPLTRMEDPYGNQIAFYYQAGVSGECRIQQILWGQNPTTGLGPSAGVVFTYAADQLSCGGVQIGAQYSYRTGTSIAAGASQLQTIRVLALPPQPVGTTDVSAVSPLHTRTISLEYSSQTTSCSAPFAPYRSLTTITESAIGVDSPQVTLPSIDFTYGDPSVAYGARTEQSLPPWSTSISGVRNLGWGYRPEAGGSWPTVEAMMLDVDGDGLIDRVVSEPYLEAGKAKFCRAHWFRNRGPNFATFSDAGYIDMPTLKWAEYPRTYQGGAYAGSIPTAPQERCSLNYQRTRYSNSYVGLLTTCQPGHTTCPSMYVDGANHAYGYCPGNGTDCGIKQNSSEDTYFSWRWMDMNGDQLPDLVGSPVAGGLGSYNLQWGNIDSPAAPAEPDIFGAFPSCTSVPRVTAEPLNWQFEPYTMCGGMFPWMVYENHGNGVFGKPRPGGSGTTHATWGPLPDRILYQPIPLESANGESSVTSKPVGQYQGAVDVDGDGFVDAVSVSSASPNQWRVFRNDGTGKFDGNSSHLPYVFGTPSGYFISKSGITPPPNALAAGIEGLEDLNGDGLVDHWQGAAGSDTSTFQPSDGVQLLPGYQGSSLRLGPDGAASVLVSDTMGPPSYYVCRGDRTDSRRTVDLDSDGRADLVKLTAPGSGILEVRYNAGGGFNGSNTTQLPGGAGFHRIRVETSTQACSGDFWWETRQDFIDLDGDGIKEDVEFSPTTMYVAKATNVAPRRLMTSIDGHRGATTTIAYSSMNGAAVEQHPEEGKSSPATNWVVQSVTTVDTFTNTTATTSYRYKRPRSLPDGGYVKPHPFAFRGFEEVETTSPSGSVTIERFSYSPDWSGRLASRLVKPSAGTTVHTIDDTTWEARTLFGGLITTFHSTATDHWACKNGQDEAACRANLDTRTHTTTKLTALSSTSTTNSTLLLWASSSDRLQAGVSLADGDRETATDYALYADANAYRLRTLATTRSQLVSGAWQMYGKSASTWDPNKGSKLTDEQWIDADPNHRLISRWVYDTNGNVTESWKPKQNAANTVKTTYTYESHQVFQATETNELGHQLDFAYEYGTGQRILTSGPNQRGCVTGTNCPLDATHPLKQQTKLRVDGLGRTIERWETESLDGGLYTLYLVEKNTYVDTVTGTVPVSVTNEQLISTGGTTWKTQKSEYSGLGRLLKSTTYVQGTAPADQVTSYTYRQDGLLATVSTPDPTANNASTVTYTYDFDSLGRPISVRRPDATNLADRSGVDMTYDGLSSTTTEVVGAALGQIAETRTVNDRYGRLIQVHERLDASNVATTTYSYGPDDEMSTIVDPEGVMTQLVHDLAGRRTAITRAGRTWEYGYDANGNQVSVTTPYPGAPNLTIKPFYTTSIAYDDLDRPTSKLIAQRALSAADRDLFASSQETFTWDVGDNRIGKLRYWGAWAPGAAQAALSADLAYDAQGRMYLDKRSVQIAGLPALSRQFLQSFHIAGAVNTTSYYDGIGSSPQLESTHLADARGLPWKVSFTKSNAVTRNTRNVAGLVINRRTDLIGTLKSADSNLAYDKLGRVIDHLAIRNISPTQIARQQLTYYGNDDVKTMTHSLGSNARTFTYSYDRRHQIIQATSDVSSYFSASYTFGTAGRFQRAVQARTTAAPGEDPRIARDVTYAYAGQDPEQVTALVNTSNGTNYASYTYDDIGNQTSRSYSDTNELLEYTYDGKDQLRRVTRKVGGVVQGSEEYWYDENGKRTQIIKRDASGTRQELVWFIGDVEAHYNGAGKISRVYSYISMGTPVARFERSTTNTSGTIEIQFHGLANSTLATVADSGTINTSFRYSPFGEVIESTNAGGASAGTASHRRRTNDKYEDESSALSYYGFRYFDKTLISWTQSDPLYRFAPDAAWISPRRGNLYTYSLNNSHRYRDPDGRMPLALPIILGVGAEALFYSVGSIYVAAGVSEATKPDESVTDIVLQRLSEQESPEGGGPSDPEADPTPIVPIPALPSNDEVPNLDDYWIRREAPTQVTPGTREITDKKPSRSRGNPEYDRTTIYDEYGREIGSEHDTTHGRPHDHTKPHHHTRDPKTGTRSKRARPGPFPRTGGLCVPSRDDMEDIVETFNSPSSPSTISDIFRRLPPS